MCCSKLQLKMLIKSTSRVFENIILIKFPQLRNQQQLQSFNTPQPKWFHCLRSIDQEQKL